MSPFRTHLWVIALEKFSLTTTPISPLLQPHNVLTTSLVYVFLTYRALSLHPHVVLQSPISMESFRDEISGTIVQQMLLMLYLDPLCHYSALAPQMSWVLLLMAHTSSLPEDMSRSDRTDWRHVEVYMSLHPPQPQCGP